MGDYDEGKDLGKLVRLVGEKDKLVCLLTLKEGPKVESLGKVGMQGFLFGL